MLTVSVAVGHAQQTGITGHVIDASGAAVPNAQVTVKEQDGASFHTQSSGSGEFQVPALCADDYTVHVEASGFTTFEQKITLLIGQTVSLDARMVPAGSSQTVTVTSSAVAVETTSSQVAGNVDPEAMKTIPLNGRNWLELATLVPGIRVNAITLLSATSPSLPFTLASAHLQSVHRSLSNTVEVKRHEFCMRSFPDKHLSLT